jgi:hypothetical protein
MPWTDIVLTILFRGALHMRHLIQANHKIRHITVAAQMVMSNSMMKEVILFFPSPRLWLASFDEQRTMFYRPWELWSVAKLAVQAS